MAMGGDAEGTFSPRQKTLIFLSDVPFYPPPSPEEQRHGSERKLHTVASRYTSHGIFFFFTQDEEGFRLWGGKKRKHWDSNKQNKKKKTAALLRPLVTFPLTSLTSSSPSSSSSLFMCPSSCSHDNGDC